MWIVHCPEFGCCPLFRSSTCIESMGTAVGTSTVVRYMVDVRYWEPFNGNSTIIIIYSSINNIIIYSSNNNYNIIIIYSSINNYNILFIIIIIYYI